MEKSIFIGGTGIVTSLKIGDSKELIGLRADMDAINLTELGKSSYKSCNVGKMHACGHDGHIAKLLGAAQLLSERKNFNGTVRLLYLSTSGGTRQRRSGYD